MTYTHFASCGTLGLPLSAKYSAGRTAACTTRWEGLIMDESPMQKANLLAMGVLVWLAAIWIFLWFITEHLDSERRIVEAERQKRAEYCTWVTVWRAGVASGIPWERRRGNPDYMRVFDKWCNNSTTGEMQ